MVNGADMTRGNMGNKQCGSVGALPYRLEARALVSAREEGRYGAIVDMSVADNSPLDCHHVSILDETNRSHLPTIINEGACGELLGYLEGAGCPTPPARAVG